MKFPTLRTLCTCCKEPVVCEWPDTMTFGGVACSAVAYMAQALNSQSVYICCDACLEAMPDVRVEDLRIKEDP